MQKLLSSLQELSQSERRFTWLFMGLLLLELACTSVDMLPPLRYLSKPALLAALIIFFVRQKNTLTQSSNMLFLAALLCSLLGDRLLLFEHLGQWFFMAGLSAFLIAHFMYSAVFLAHRDSHQYVGYCGDDELRLIKNKNHKPNQLLLGAGRRRFICCIR